MANCIRKGVQCGHRRSSTTTIKSKSMCHYMLDTGKKRGCPAGSKCRHWTDKYVYTGSGTFTLYRKGKTKSAEERKREKKQAEFAEQAQSLDGRIRELIHDFVKNYRSKFNSTFIELFKLYAKNYILAVDGQYAISNANMSKLGKLYGVQVSQTWPKSVTEADADEMCEDFIRLILSVFYSNLPDYGFLCANSNGMHMLTRNIELMYEALKICGYEMSDEERDYFNGTHEIFAIMGEK